jgi:hypothetical protein
MFEPEFVIWRRLSDGADNQDKALRKILWFTSFIGSSLSTLTSTALKQHGISFKIPSTKVAEQTRNS